MRRSSRRRRWPTRAPTSSSRTASIRGWRRRWTKPRLRATRSKKRTSRLRWTPRWRRWRRPPRTARSHLRCHPTSRADSRRRAAVAAIRSGPRRSRCSRWWVATARSTIATTCACLRGRRAAASSAVTAVATSRQSGHLTATRPSRGRKRTTARRELATIFWCSGCNPRTAICRAAMAAMSTPSPTISPISTISRSLPLSAVPATRSHPIRSS